MRNDKKRSRRLRNNDGMAVIAVANHKGGVGKTEISRHVAHLAIENKQSIVLFDADKQSDASRSLLPVGEKEEYADFERTQYVLVTKNFADVQAYRSERIAVCDCPPQAEGIRMLTQFVDFWVIPVGNDDFEVVQAIHTAETFLKGKKFAFVLSRWDTDSSNSSVLMKRLFEVGKIHRSILHRDSDVVADARMNRVPVWDEDEELGDVFIDVSEWILAGCPASDEEDDDYYMTKDDLEDDYDVDFEKIRKKERKRYV